MGLYIDKQFYSELFDEKVVKINNRIYIMLFDKIWPRAENFMSFLTSSEPSLKIKYAKEIYKSFTCISDIFLPSFSMLNVLNDQYFDFDEKNSKYVPQDHFIHSIYTYILGIYLYFNSDKINKKFLKYGCDYDFYTSTKEFIFKWQLFALYHDIGYFFESGNLSNKNIEEYVNIFEVLIRNVISNHITRTLLFKTYLEKASSRFEKDCLYQPTTSWYDINENRTSVAEVEKNIERYLGAITLECIKNDEDLEFFLSSLSSNEYLVAVYDEFGSCESLIIREGLNVKKIFSKSISISKKIFVSKTLNTFIHGYVFKYYFIDIDDNKFWDRFIDNPLVMTNVCSKLPLALLSDVSLSDDKVTDILLKINDWLSDLFTCDPTEEQLQYHKKINECFYESLVNQIVNYTNKFIEDNHDEKMVNNKEDDNNKRDKLVKKLCKFLWGSRGGLLEATTLESKDLYNQRFATTHDIIAYFSEVCTQLNKNKNLSISKKSLEIFNSSVIDYKNIQYFKYDLNNPFHAELFKLINKSCDSLNISYDVLIKYQSPYAKIDHGIISANLLFQAVCFLNDIRTNDGSSLMLNSFYDDKNRILRLTSDTIFAILLHNIYSKKYVQYGIDYCHNIDINPFSYFCALCDTLQIWGRSKKRNLAKTDLPNLNYLEDEFNITISDGRIIISCLKQNINKTVRRIRESESFLPGISKLIEVNEF